MTAYDVAKAQHTHIIDDVTDVTTFAKSVLETAVDAATFRSAIGAGTGSGSSVWGGITGTLGDQTDLASALAAKYTKPAGGIPETDLDTGTQGKIDGALQSVPAATSTVTGGVRLTGDLGGTATAPTVPGLASKINSSQIGAASGVAGLDSGGHALMAQAAPGVRFTVLSTAGGWPARPSSRTDIYFDWIDANALGTDPPGWLDGDSVLKAA